jgi:hypothetical protein
MRNFEKYESAVKDYGFYFGLDKNTRELFECCTKDDCEKCSFMNHNCHIKKMEWLYEEYKEKEPIRLSTIEYQLLEFALQNNYKYMVRNKNIEGAFLYKVKPVKEGKFWDSGSPEYNYYDFSDLLSDLFPFVKREDTEPYSIKEILENCKIVD